MKCNTYCFEGRPIISLSSSASRTKHFAHTFASTMCKLFTRANDSQGNTYKYLERINSWNSWWFKSESEMLYKNDFDSEDHFFYPLYFWTPSDGSGNSAVFLSLFPAFLRFSLLAVGSCTTWRNKSNPELTWTLKLLKVQTTREKNGMAICAIESKNIYDA